MFVEVAVEEKIFLEAMSLYYGDKSAEIWGKIWLCIVWGTIFYNVIFAPSFICEIFFDVKIPSVVIFLWVIFLIVAYVYMSVNKKNTDHYVTFLFFLGIFVIFSNIISGNFKDNERNVSSKNYSSHYHSSSGNYSNSSYRHSDSSSYTPPIEKNSSDENKISVNPPKVSEEIKIQEQQTEEKISEEPKNQNLISEEKSDENFTLQENEKNDSPEDKKTFQSYSYTSDEWEYIMSDENGNDYYISKYYPINIFDSQLEGKTFSAEFKKVLSNGGYEVDVSSFDKNYNMTTEKKILSYEEKVIDFRNENGFKEFRISVTTGYDENDSIIVEYEIDNIKNFMEWQSVNNTLYNELYEAAYSRLK